MVICNRVSGKCSSMGCFNAYNNKEATFERYKDQDVRLEAYAACARCVEEKEEKILSIAERFKEKGVEIVHFGICAVNCKEDLHEDTAKMFTDLGIEVVERTH